MIDHLWRKRAWLLLWLHSACFIVPIIAFFVAIGISMSFPRAQDLPNFLAFFLCAIPALLFVVLSIPTLITARKKQLVHSAFVAMFALALPVAAIAVTAFTYLGYLGAGAVAYAGNLLIFMGLLLGSLFAFCNAIEALIRISPEITKREILTLGCGQHEVAP
jgi:hypothetical protein